ncbi:uncharacterized protein MELLADRAFT_33402 [Melampsora larici-populina 98AG31]|uniref:Helitron helicase-like domain-containing protein n=1 Tax=Melampsora larici-populina (strain 98AG31 / pathotype 3-4-7) TaxID=747676 RepID=F4R8Q5_MELLP|nr:uncharacterized protein MELLADRAFT_33402 [Melampsora larici-populina 98AG31]EGG11065.1 hypothetical protein MELLADRAFT_33402 [Melampsora larici-populina 98AG31]
MVVNNGPAARNIEEASETSILARFVDEVPFNIGDCNDPCKDCRALHWKLERPKGTKNADVVSFPTCCQQGAVKLPSHLAKSHFLVLKDFRKNIQRYNNALSFASTGAKQDMTVTGKGGSWTYKISGRLTHRIGSLFASHGVKKKFAQMFMFGDEGDNKGLARSAFVGGKLDLSLLRQFQTFMYDHNPFARMYKSAQRLLNENTVKTIKIKSLPIAGRDKNQYNFPTCDEVSAVIDGDGVVGSLDRDIILQRVSGKLRRISKLNTNYFSLRYPIFFMFGSHGWDEHYRHMNTRSLLPFLF